MKSSLIIFVLVHIMHMSTGMSQHVPKEIGIDALNHVNIVGRIGVHLGKAVVVDVVVAADDQSGSKSSEGYYFLQVRNVDGVPLKTKVFMPFEVRGSNLDGDDPFGGGSISIPTNSFELCRLKNGRNGKELSSKEIRDLEKGFIGRQYKLLAYETGMFSGIPKELPKDYPVWQGRSFSFSTHLVVLGEHK